MPSIPTIPGELIPRDSERGQWLRQGIAAICKIDSYKFPGAQPVSFLSKDLEKLEKRDYWVCEKSDGVRVLLLVQTVVGPQGPTQAVFLIDRKNDYRELEGIYFPHHEDPMSPMFTSLIDGELVMDVDPVTKSETMRFLAFDCLIVNDENVMDKTLDKRYGRLQAWFFAPYSQMLKDIPHVVKDHPFEIRVKKIKASYHVEEVFNIDLPKLQHGTDGLIYTCVSTPYQPGTDPNIMKWKPPSENSIDLKLVLRFPPSETDPKQPDIYAKPVFLLQAWAGGEGQSSKHEQFDLLSVSDEEWEQMKQSGQQYDDRIIEVHWDKEKEQWRFMRFRDDKPNANFRTIVESVIESIADGVEKEALIARSADIRAAWKARAGQPPAAAASTSRPATVKPEPVILTLRYGPLAAPAYSKVSGPTIVAGFHR